MMRLPIQIEGILFRRVDGKIEYLILKRRPSKKHPEMGEFWQPVTGGLEKGETKNEALRREVREETGITNIIKIIEDVHFYEAVDLPLIEYFRSQGHVCKHLKVYVFGVEVSSDENVVLDGKEHSEYKWCSFQEVLRLVEGTCYDHTGSFRRLNEIVAE